MSPISYADKMSPIKWAENQAKAKAEEQAKEQEEAKAKEQEATASIPPSSLISEEQIAGASPTITVPEPKPAASKPAARKAK